MRIGIISGSGTYEWPGLTGVTEMVSTPYGRVELAQGRNGTVDIVALSRHERGHARLSNNVQHRANIAALRDAKVDGVISLTMCGAVDPEVPLGSLLIFDDLYFPGNRLPEGDLCTWYDAPGAPRRGHWIFDRPFSEPLRAALIEGARRRHIPARSTGCYGHVEGPRFNSRAEIRSLAMAGVTAVSQTCGPEAVLAGEAELPLAVVGFVTDYANGVAPAPEPVDALLARMRDSTEVLASLLEGTCECLERPMSAGMVYRFEG